MDIREKSMVTIIIGTYHTYINGQKIQRINQETLADMLGKMNLSEYMYRISHTRSRIHILFKCKWNILEGRSHARPGKAILDNPKETENHIKHLLQVQCYDTKIRFQEKKNFAPKKKMWRYTQMWQLNKVLLNNQQITRINQRGK